MVFVSGVSNAVIGSGSAGTASGVSASASSTLAAKSLAGQKAISSSPESAKTWNSWEWLPPIEPVSASTGR